MSYVTVNSGRKEGSENHLVLREWDWEVEWQKYRLIFHSKGSSAAEMKGQCRERIYSKRLYMSLLASGVKLSKKCNLSGDFSLGSVKNCREQHWGLGFFCLYWWLGERNGAHGECPLAEELPDESSRNKPSWVNTHMEIHVWLLISGLFSSPDLGLD